MDEAIVRLQEGQLAETSRRGSLLRHDFFEDFTGIFYKNDMGYCGDIGLDLMGMQPTNMFFGFKHIGAKPHVRL